METTTERNYPQLPESYRPELLRRLTLKEILLVAAQFGIIQVAERIGYDEFVLFFKNHNAAVGGSNGQAT